MDIEILEAMAWWQVYQENVERFRRGAILGAKPADCTCPKIWGSVLPPPPCPYHGRLYNTQITC